MTTSLIILTVTFLILYLISIRQRNSAEYKIIELKARHEKEVLKAREDSVKKSKSVINGKVLEVVAQHLPGFPVDCDDLSFLGNPIDYVAFSNTEDEDNCSVTFLEVKTGASRLSKKQRIIKKAIQEGRVNWEEFKIKYL